MKKIFFIYLEKTRIKSRKCVIEGQEEGNFLHLSGKNTYVIWEVLKVDVEERRKFPKSIWKKQVLNLESVL